MTADAFGLLGLARKAGKLEIGEEPVAAACSRRQAALVLLAADAAENTRRRIRRWCEGANAPCISLSAGKEELGTRLGRSSCAAAALTDHGFASALRKKLAAEEAAGQQKNLSGVETGASE